jgi:FkbM family methyltransferase
MNRLAGYAFKISLKLRHNPARFLFRDFFFNLSNPYDAGELQFARRPWTGDVWDIGASVGKFTGVLAQANPDHRVFAFEPNLNSIYFLAYRTSRFKNVVIVPAALTLDGKPMTTSYNPDFSAPPTGPQAMTLSLAEALQKFGKPSFIKMDIEGAEFRLFREQASALKGVHLLVEWHTMLLDDPIPALPYWKVTRVDDTHTYLEPI